MSKLSNKPRFTRKCSGSGKTILDAFQEHYYLKPKCKKNPVIPQGGSILTPKPPEFKTYYTKCRNGSRKIPAYYLGGRRVNALGFALSQQDIKHINQHSCLGCAPEGCHLNRLQGGCQSKAKYLSNPGTCPYQKSKKTPQGFPDTLANW